MARHHKLRTSWGSLRGTASLALGLITAVTATVVIGTTGPSIATASTAVATPPAPPAVPHPFNKLTCALQTYGIRLCQGGQQGATDLRIPSFDGVPLDADLALPATGQGPFPLIVLLHGLGGSKADYEVTANDGGIDDVTLADKGYAVLMYTARGFGDSCGTAASRANTPACAKGFIQLADQRYEVRDTQYLAGELVDEGLVKPTIAAAGVSYGGGQSLELATLKNRMRLPNGRYVPFTSPVRHVPMSVGAVYAMWPWDDLATALAPNGHLSTTSYTPPIANLIPAGVPKESWNTLLYGVAADYYVAPPWRSTAVRPHPLVSPAHGGLALYRHRHAGALRRPDLQVGHRHSAGTGGPAPTAIQSGWTDTLFPVSEALHYANRIESSRPAYAAAHDVRRRRTRVGPEQAGRCPSHQRPRPCLLRLDHAVAHQSLNRCGHVGPNLSVDRTVGQPRHGPIVRALQDGVITLNGPQVRTVTSTRAGTQQPPPPSIRPTAQTCAMRCPPHEKSARRTTACQSGPSPKNFWVRSRERSFRHPRQLPRSGCSPVGCRSRHTRQIVAMGVYRPVVNQRVGTTTRALGAQKSDSN